MVFLSLSYLCNSDNTQESGGGEVFFYEVGKEEADQGETDDDKVKDAPAVEEVVVPQGKHLHAHFSREDNDEPGMGVEEHARKSFHTLSWRCPRQTSRRCSC